MQHRIISLKYFYYRSLKVPKESVVIAHHKSAEEETIKAGEGNDSADVKSLLNPESRLLNRRRRDTPTDSAVKENTKSGETPVFTDAHGVSTTTCS